MFNLTKLKPLVILVPALLISACSEEKQVESVSTSNAQTVDVSQEQLTVAQQLKLEVFKSPTCGCCKTWMSHLEQSDFLVNGYDTDELSQIKFDKGIKPQYQSCHTAISPEGFVFEGHVPAKFIHQFLSEEHGEDVLGLSVPAMPIGSPGMEMGDKFMPYQVLLLKADGSAQVYAQLNSYEEQF